MWDQLRLKMPLVGSIFERIALARFAKTFAILGRSGVPIVTALNVVADVVGNKYIGKQVAGMGGGVSRGESLYLTAQRSEIFLPLVLQMIAVGEESGSLPDLLDEVSDFYDGEVEYDLKPTDREHRADPHYVHCGAGADFGIGRVFADLGSRSAAAR